MVQQKGMKVATLLTLFTLSGCSSIRDVEYIDPEGYSDVASYLSETFEKSNCIGTTFSSQGRKFINSDGLNYQLSATNIRCYVASIEESIDRYCVAKQGEMVQGGTWCVVNKMPLFHVKYSPDTSLTKIGLGTRVFSTVEPPNSQAKQQWLSSAERLGYISERAQQQIDINNKIDLANEIDKKQKKYIEMNAEVDASIGDLICREDYEAKPYQYPGIAYYKAYVEKKEKNKLQLRLVWHGGDGFVVNDITNVNNIIWSSPKGWRHCN